MHGMDAAYRYRRSGVVVGVGHDMALAKTAEPIDTLFDSSLAWEQQGCCGDGISIPIPTTCPYTWGSPYPRQTWHKLTFSTAILILFVFLLPISIRFRYLY